MGYPLSPQAAATMRRRLVVYASFTIFEFEVSRFLRGWVSIRQLGNVTRRKMPQNVRHGFFAGARRYPQLS